VQQLALQALPLCGCRDMSRTDAIIGSDGSIRIIETNTIPGLTDQSLLPREALAAGISMPQLCQQLVQAALQR
jgi:D-alanine-D-alanine ligase